MGSIKILIMSYARSMWRRRWYAMGVAWAVCIVGWVTVSRMPDLYESQARLYMNAGEALTPLLKGIAVDNDIDARLERMQRTLLSSTNMKKLIKMTDLDMQVKNVVDQERMVNKLQTSIIIKPQTRNLFTVSYRDTNPQLAQSVVSNVLSIFMESSAGDTRDDMDSAQRFLQTQIDRLETQLREAERKRAEFRSRYYDLLPMGDSGTSNLDTARSTVQSLTDDLNDAIASRDSLQKELEALPPVVTIPGQTTPTGTEGLSLTPQIRLAQLQTQLEAYKSSYTDAHPNVVALKHQIDALSEEIKKTDAAAKKNPKAAASKQSVENPMYTDMKMKLVDAETKIASIRRRLASSEEERDKLEDEQRRAPGVSAEYLNLDRDYEVVKRNHEELLARRESAQISQEADKKGDKVDIKTIDPPEVPSVPVAPNRPLYLSMALFAGLGAGIGVAFLLSQIDSSYSTTTALQALGLPILGSISVVNSNDRKPQYWFLGAKGFAIASAALVVVYGGLMLINIGLQYKAV